MQWDKDDCAAIGLAKFDLLDLGMLSTLHYVIDLVAEHHDVHIGLHDLDLADPAVYDMLFEADAVGMFQVESRAQLGTLPRLRPRRLYDLVAEVALIRPGPAQGGSVHPYIRRRGGEEQWQHAHPLLAPAIERTLGADLFQEHVMQMPATSPHSPPPRPSSCAARWAPNDPAQRWSASPARFFEGAAANCVPPSSRADL
ncbi:hypothetical protein [Amycolatopsis sp. NPDC051372]|uniref:hypothetical protein n=1 Tax=unclassified Amycolatopsis TaxID=2618356 RepID=UPI00344956D0